MLPVQAERMTERKKSSIQSAITKIQSLFRTSAGKCGTRTVQPQKLIFRGQAWYLYGMYSQNEPENPADKEKSLADKKKQDAFFQAKQNEKHYCPERTGSS